jgi:hypothetical protein
MSSVLLFFTSIFSSSLFQPTLDTSSVPQLPSLGVTLRNQHVNLLSEYSRIQLQVQPELVVESLYEQRRFWKVP